MDQILFDQYNIVIQYCIDQIEFVNRKKNWKKEMIKNIKKDRYGKLYLSF